MLLSVDVGPVSVVGSVVLVPPPVDVDFGPVPVVGSVVLVPPPVDVEPVPVDMSVALMLLCIDVLVEELDDDTDGVAEEELVMVEEEDTTPVVDVDPEVGNVLSFVPGDDEPSGGALKELDEENDSVDDDSVIELDPGCLEEKVDVSVEAWHSSS